MPPRRAWSAVLAGLWLTLAAAGPAAAEARQFDLGIANGRLPEAQRLLRVRQGDEVTLRWTVDRAAVLHLHGYDIEARVSPGAPVEMRFTASATGRFPIELHTQTHATIAHLEVHPR